MRWLCILLTVLIDLTSAWYVHAATQLETYANARYGFTIQWPQGAYTVKEADNGDGITLTDGRGLTAKAYGTMAYSVLEQSFDDIATEMISWFDSITEQNRLSKNMLTISGFKKGNRRYVKMLYAADNVCVLLLDYPKAASKTYGTLAATMSTSFARSNEMPPPDDAPSLWVTPMADGAAMPTVQGSVYSYTAPHWLGDTRFLLRPAAGQEIELIFYTPQLDSQGRLETNDVLYRKILRASDACLLRYTMPEVMPTLMICIGGTARCWSPAISGMDGSLEMADGFILQ